MPDALKAGQTGLEQQVAPVSVVLDIPARLQWPTNHGYCGELCLQMTGLFNGAWISQYVAREVGGGGQGDSGQLLLPFYPDQDEDLDGKNLRQAALTLGLSVVSFPSKEAKQSKQFLLWARQQLLKHRPVIYAVYLSVDEDPDYDHIVPAVGYIGTTSATYSESDRLLSYTLFSTDVVDRTFASLPSGPSKPVSPTSCKKTTLEGGNIPLGINYAVSIPGFRDPEKVGKPVRLAIDRNDEPNVTLGEPACLLTGTATVSELTSGKRYRLLRYDSVSNVPVSGNAAAWLASKFDNMIDFTASGTTWTYEDPKKIVSNGVAFYKCVTLD